MNANWEKRFLAELGQEGILLDDESRERLSKDYYWYSPILKPKLAQYLADGIVVPKSEEELVKVIKIAVEHRIPVTLRGAGTGNYGQAIPLTGGIVLDMSQLQEVLEIQPGYARVQAGVKLGQLERRLREAGQEMCIYPSTFMKSTAAGFVCGGSAGIGSVEWGFLWDGNVMELTVLTMEEEPRRLTISGKENLLTYIHAYGTTGIVTEVVYRLTTRTEWTQIITSFDSTADALRFANELAYDSSVKKRLISQCEWPIPAYFLPLAKLIVPEKDVVFLEVSEENQTQVEALVHKHHGQVSHVIPAANYHKGISLSDYTWNHSTLWGMKANPNLTYLQCEFHRTDFLQQVSQIKARFGDEYLTHFEYLRNDGLITPQCIPLITFQSEEKLAEMVRFLHSIGVQTFDPHTFILEEGGWTEHIDAVIATKQQNDPYSLLNPGKIGKLQKGSGQKGVIA
ncbi:FAD-binding oxidoreductase [Brevibacillus sp. B_LB10_24]|uniref:FAD-binding oxidoreductase n=1 Tax=Brevibacillus sp. B_LB10_24 TaxID=3380645 RepID=UPI0038BC9B27